ncbi:Metallo-peptidase family M12-domain-containing protein [Massariosphaeria phaeospora]|uniref:Disintegrin and metalloproteinase domain-containing protein B n=1 Tax=Massariosphaeria phaeospora TaxID=100035 RepID=A0A7C8M0R2_9PLEO|nr:Metallo-peptidase family M12-domain-containing protein [Massariosphaeria phaeospora]
MLIARAVTAAVTLALATVTTAASTARNPLKTVGLAKNPSILTANHRVHALSTFDVAFDFSGARIRLSLEPNHDIFVEGATIQYLRADGSLSRQEPIDRLQHKVYKGTAWLKRGNRWDKVGWARIDIRRDGMDPLFEGTFTVDHDHHHVQLSSHYQQTRHELDPDLETRPDEVMVVFRDSDTAADDEHSELKKRSGGLACGSDQLGFNKQDDHPVYVSMRPRGDKLFSTPYSALLGKRLIDGTPGGGNGAGVNLVQTIGNTRGCPSTRKVALVGVATDCTYTRSFNTSSGDPKDLARDSIIGQMNKASELFESSFNISLGLANLIVTEPNCPTMPQQATPWNQDCKDNLNITGRLNLFSQWRGQQADQNSHWTLLTKCNTQSAVGLAWLGQACTSGSQGPGSSDGSAESVAGANVVVRTSTEWQVIAHETGHTYGAVHDCTQTECSNQNMLSAQQCCPLSGDTCDAGERFIMNPSTAQGITLFSACSIGNICSALGRNSVKSSCLSNNRGVTTVSGQRCGNGIVEGDEQCDCGGTQGCGDNQCCDPTTCRFRETAVCDDSNEDCCNNCQFASASIVCRPGSQCDPEERCTGTTPYCPDDKTEPDGSDCGNGLKCASGQCTSRDQQCKTVMGTYTQGNDTFACDNRNCMLSCASPEFGRDVCYGLQQNFLDGTSCAGGGTCQNGQCAGASVGNEVKKWIMDNKPIVIGVAAGVGGLLMLCIVGCCWRSYKRRKTRKVYAANHAAVRGPPPPPPRQPYYGGHDRPRRDGRRSAPPIPHPNTRGASAVTENRSRAFSPNQWQPQTGHDVPVPPPMYQRSSSVRYA